MFDEFQWIHQLKSEDNPFLNTGIGDDAAIFQGEHPWAISTDTLVENVHFLSSDHPKNIAQKLVHVNISDMAAMGCQPLFFLLNLQMTPSYVGKAIQEFKDKLLTTLNSFHISLIGGDTTSSQTGPLSLTGTILGKPFGDIAIKRSGAKDGDLICVTGKLGGSFPKRHLTFTPRLEWSRILCEQCTPNAMIDISDGLLQDLQHILDQSSLGANVDLQNIPIHEDAASNKNPLESALGDGEDFELLFTISQDKKEFLPKEIEFNIIGQMTSEHQSQIWGKHSEKESYLPIASNGFKHQLHF